MKTELEHRMQRPPDGGHLLWRVAGAVVCLLAMQACATLPDTGDRSQPVEQVDFEGAKGLVSQRRGAAILSNIEGSGGASGLLDRHLAYEQELNAGSPLVLGNKLTLLQNGPATYAAMFAAIDAAKDHINLETYIFEADEIGAQFSERLIARQAAGVQVNLIYDSVGSLTTPQSFFDRLRKEGVKVVEFNPVNPLADNPKTWLINNRDHRKLLVVDGRIAFVGGINISSTYSSAPSKRSAPTDAPGNVAGGWRDTHIQIEGPVVSEFQKLFIGTWTKQKGEPLTAGDYFPEIKRQGDEIVRAIGSTPDDPESLIYLTLMSAIAHAEKEVLLTIAYFAPDPQLLDALKDAERRGVDVKLILPSRTDSGQIFHLGRSYYSQLLRSGVRIYERRGAVMHAKIVCIDGVWSTIGSTNLDWRSFLHNDEINAVVLGRGFATQVEGVFVADIRESDEIALKQWRKRSLLLRIKERLARIGAYWL